MLCHGQVLHSGSVADYYVMDRKRPQNCVEISELYPDILTLADEFQSRVALMRMSDRQLLSEADVHGG